MRVQEDNPKSPHALELLREHLAGVAEHSPPESIHALDVDALCAPNITFWTVQQGGAALGCGALQELESTHGEIKSMRTARAHLRKGVASALLQHIIDVARHRNYTRLSLETGSQEGFAPARALYTRFGFQTCDPFADYTDDPNSVFMTRALKHFDVDSEIANKSR